MTIAQIVHKLTTDQTFAAEMISTAPAQWPFDLSADNQAALQAVLERNWQKLHETSFAASEENPWT